MEVQLNTFSCGNSCVDYLAFSSALFFKKLELMHIYLLIYPAPKGSQDPLSNPPRRQMFLLTQVEVHSLEGQKQGRTQGQLRTQKSRLTALEEMVRSHPKVHFPIHATLKTGRRLDCAGLPHQSRERNMPTKGFSQTAHPNHTPEQVSVDKLVSASERSHQRFHPLQLRNKDCRE